CKLPRLGCYAGAGRLGNSGIHAPRRRAGSLPARVADHAEESGRNRSSLRAFRGSTMNRREFLATAAAPAFARSGQFTKSTCSVIFPPRTPLPECFRQAKNAGFDAIEIRMGDEISLDSTPDQMKQLAGEAHKAGVAIASMWVSRPL